MSLHNVIAPLVPGLRRYAHALCDAAEGGGADEVVQKALRRAVDDERIKRGADPRLTLYHLVTVLNRGRARDAEMRQSEHAAVGGSGKAIVNEKIGGSSIERGLTGLPLELREVLLLVSLERLNYEEVADVLEVPVATALARLTRARDGLRHSFNGNMRQKIGARPMTSARGAKHLRVIK